MSNPEPAVLVERRDHVAIVSFNRPENLNALDVDIIHGLTQALIDLDADPEARAIILTGNGRAFCAGANVKVMDKLAREDGGTIGRIDLRDMHRLQLTFQGLGTPIIAAVNGPAVGAGFDLALACDVRIAGERARFGQTFARLGLMSGDGGSWLLPRVVGVAWACELIFTGDVIDARKAQEIGLIRELVLDGQLMDSAMALAERFAAGPPLAIRESRLAIYRDLNRDLADVLPDILPAMERLRQTEDHREGVRAFVEKRVPRFAGR